MDRRVLVLALGTFAVGTDGFGVAGILPRIASSLNTTVTAAGLLVTAFALVYAVMSPVMAALTAAWPRKNVLLAGLVILAAGNALAAVLPTYGLVLAARALTGVGAAMYTPTAMTTAAAISPPERRGRALAIVWVGLSSATALGSPIGTIVGSTGSWRGTMWFFAALAAAAALGVLALLRGVPALPAISLRRRLAPLSDARITLTLLTTVLVMAGIYTVYTYISVSYDRATGGSGDKLAALLFCFGAAATVGNLVSGSLTDRFGSRWVINATILLAAVDFALMPVTSAHLATAVLAILVWGLTGWGLLVPQQHRLIEISPVAAPLAIALNASAIYIAISASGLTGSAGIHLAGAHKLGLFSAAFIIGGLLCAEAAKALMARRAVPAAEAVPQSQPQPQPAPDAAR